MRSQEKYPNTIEELSCNYCERRYFAYSHKHRKYCCKGCYTLGRRKWPDTKTGQRQRDAKKYAVNRENIIERVKKWNKDNISNIRPRYLKYKQAAQRKMYSLTEAEQNKLLEITACEICKSKTARLVFDHNHKNGYVRGRLCNRCNLSIGQFDDNPTILEAAATYLRDRTIKK